MDERYGNEKKYELQSLTSILADNSYQFVKECFSPFTPFLQTKIKSCKSNQSHGYKQFEQCAYKITYRPHIQLFKTNQEYKVKTTDESPAQHQRKPLKTTKTVNKIFHHNSTDSESLKIYRDLYIYKSLGSVARKNLERAVAIYNANRDEIELTRRFTSRRNANSQKMELPHHKKVIKTETYLKTIKPKSDVKENIIKELKYSQRVISSQNKTSQLMVSETTASKNITKLSKEESYEEVKKQRIESSKEFVNATDAPKNQVKKMVVRSDIKQTLPKLPVRPIERKKKEKKQLVIQVLNLSLPTLNEKKEVIQRNLRPKIKKKSLLNTVHNNYNASYKDLDGSQELDEDLYHSFNRKRIMVNDINGTLCSSSENKMSSTKRGYLLKLPVRDMMIKGLKTPSTNFSLLSFKETEKKNLHSSAINNSLAMLPEHITKEQKDYSMMENLSLIQNYPLASNNLKKIKRKKDFDNQLSMEKDKKIRTCELSTSLNRSDQEYCYKTKIDYSRLRKILLNL